MPARKKNTPRPKRRKTLPEVMRSKAGLKRLIKATDHRIEPMPARPPRTVAQRRRTMKDWSKTELRDERKFMIEEMTKDLHETISDLVYLSALDAEMDSRVRKGGAK